MQEVIPRKCSLIAVIILILEYFLKFVFVFFGYWQTHNIHYNKISKFTAQKHGFALGSAGGVIA